VNPHESWTDELRAEAEAYVAGSLRKERHSEFEAHLTDCPLCRPEVDALEAVVAGLALAAPEAEPSDAVWEQVQAQLANEVQTWRGWTADDPTAGPLGLFLARGDERAWEPTGVMGIEAQRLFQDTEADRVTMLVRMAPGTSYPAHVHGGPEECYVLEGDLAVGEGLEMRAGDYQRAETGSTHPVQSTRGGCLLLLTSSLRDELVA
jgi:anti-sigma factor ChrR (cupin superfamily)